MLQLEGARNSKFSRIKSRSVFFSQSIEMSLDWKLASNFSNILFCALLYVMTFDWSSLKGKDLYQCRLKRQNFTRDESSYSSYFSPIATHQTRYSPSLFLTLTLTFTLGVSCWFKFPKWFQSKQKLCDIEACLAQSCSVKRVQITYISSLLSFLL